MFAPFAGAYPGSAVMWVLSLCSFVGSDKEEFHPIDEWAEARRWRAGRPTPSSRYFRREPPTLCNGKMSKTKLGNSCQVGDRVVIGPRQPSVRFLRGTLAPDRQGFGNPCCRLFGRAQPGVRSPAPASATCCSAPPTDCCSAVGMAPAAAAGWYRRRSFWNLSSDSALFTETVWTRLCFRTTRFLPIPLLTAFLDLARPSFPLLLPTSRLGSFLACVKRSRFARAGVGPVSPGRPLVHGPCRHRPAAGWFGWAPPRLGDRGRAWLRGQCGHGDLHDPVRVEARGSDTNVGVMRWKLSFGR